MKELDVPGEHVYAIAKYFLDETSKVMKTSDKVSTIVTTLADANFDIGNPVDYEFLLDLAQGLMVLESLRVATGLYSS